MSGIINIPTRSNPYNARTHKLRQNPVSPILQVIGQSDYFPAHTNL